MQNLISISTQAFEQLLSFLRDKSYSQLAVLVDDQTKKYCYPKLEAILPPHHVIEIECGEEAKHLGTCLKIWQEMTHLAMDRKSLLLNLGGGVIGDMGGFCASTYKRGIDFVQIPTTLLAQVDASVGGKLGIDFQGFKNHIGVFRDPTLVLIDVHFLETLPLQELRSGFAEIIKHCLIADQFKWKALQQEPLLEITRFFKAHRLDNSSQLFEYASELNQEDYLASLFSDLVSHSVRIKSNVVESDPLEKGRRKILNFGHTLGHALESFYLEQGERRLLHGEAIAMGMICESYLSYRKGFISQEAVEEISQYILNIFPPFEIEPSETAAILELTKQDKKNQDGKVMYSLLQSIGEANFNQVITEAEAEEGIDYYRSLIKNG